MKREDIARMLDPLTAAVEPDNEENQLFHRDVLLMEFDRLTVEVRQLEEFKALANAAKVLERQRDGAIAERDKDRADLDFARKVQVVLGGMLINVAAENCDDFGDAETVSNVIAAAEKRAREVV